MIPIRINFTAMFASREPRDCSNSVANLGPRAAELTWQCAIEIANAYKSWLLTPLPKALAYIHTWALETGAWEPAEVEKWTAREALALFVQNVAHDLRLIGSDDLTLEQCAAKYAETDWEQESEYPIMCVYVDPKTLAVHGEVHS